MSVLGVGSEAPLTAVSMVSGAWLDKNVPAVTVLSAMHILVSYRKAG